MSGPIYINVDEFLAACGKVSMTATGLVMELLSYGNNGAFKWDPAAIAEAVSRRGPHAVSPAEVDTARTDLLQFFVEIRPNLWAPDPKIFSSVDGNPGRQS